MPEQDSIERLVALVNDLGKRLNSVERDLALLKKKSLSPDEASELLGLPKKGGGDATDRSG